MGKAVQDAGENLLPLGIKGPEPLSLWETIFLKLLTPRAADGTDAKEGGEGGAGLQGWKAKPVRLGCRW